MNTTPISFDMGIPLPRGPPLPNSSETTRALLSEAWLSLTEPQPGRRPVRRRPGFSITHKVESARSIPCRRMTK